MIVGLIQADIKPHKIDFNLWHYEKLIAESITQHVDLLVFPELFACGFSNDIPAEAETMSGKSVIFLTHIAQKYHTEVVATLPIVENQQVLNRLVWLSENGIMGYYDKRHLFMGDEQNLCTAGAHRQIVNSHGHTFLPLICYDVRFPVWSRNRFIDNKLEYDCLLFLTNFPAPREKVLRSLCVARAIENQAYVLVVNRIGEDGNGYEHFGGSAVISPEGNILQAAGFNQEQIILQALDFDKLSEIRRRFPVFQQWDNLSDFSF